MTGAPLRDGLSPTAEPLRVSSADAASIPSADSHRGWAITWDYGFYTATGPDYDASWEGEEEGWVDNGHRVTARTREGVILEIDAVV